MKTTHKLGLLGAFAAASIFVPMNAQALSTTLPEADANGTITLTDDVTLPTTLVLKADSNVKVIDLNGHTLTRGIKYGYLINSSTDLTIKNGNIVCGKEQDVIDGNKKETQSSSCVRNNKSLNVENANIKAYWTALKAEEGTNLTIKNSTVSSESGTAGTILNYGTANIENSNIKAAAVPNGAAIFTMSYAESADKTWGASVLVKGSTVEGYWPVLIGKYDETSDTLGLPTKVTFEGENTIISDGGFLRKDTDREDTKLEISGKITAPIDALEYLESGDTLVVNKDIAEDVLVPEGITIVLPQGTKVTGKLKMETDSIIENKSGEAVEIVIEVDGEEKTLVVENMQGLTVGKEETPDDPTEPTEPSDPTEPTDPTEPEGPKDDHQPSENPKTFDGVTAYAALALVSVGALGLVLKKNLD